MRHSFTRIALCTLMFSLAGAFAGTTGSISGTIVDNSGDSLPGVTVLLTSSAMIGSRSLVTDATGKYRAVFLTPGTYEVTATFSGFRTQKSTVRVEIDGNQVVDLRMELEGVGETLVVTADQPTIDPSSTEIGANIGEEVFTKLPVGRRVTAVMELAPGVSTPDVDGSFRVNGASGPENQYIIDGVNTTAIERGGESANLNFDFVQEVQVKTGGYNAEFGRATGGILNVITKSGGNEFEGSVYAYNDTRDSVAHAENEGVTGSTALGLDRSDYGVTVGGPIIKDRLWFFTGLNPQTSKSYSATPDSVLPSTYDPNQGYGGYDGHSTWQQLRGEEETVRTERDILAWALKLTYQVNQNNTLTLSGNGDPQEIIGRDPSGLASTDSFQDVESDNYILKWNSILNHVFTLDASISRHEESQNVRARDGQNLTHVRHGYANPNTGDIGGLGLRQNQDGSRDDYNFKIGAFLGNHDIKAGIQYEKTSFTDSRGYTGYGFVTYDPRHLSAYPHGFLSVRNFGGIENDDVVPIDAQIATTRNNYTSYFIQDSWSVTPNLTVNLGLRDEVQELLNSEGGTFHKFDGNLAPRLGFTWDLLGNGRSKLYGHWGRFYQSLPMDINNRAAAPEIILTRLYAISAGTPADILQWDEATMDRLIGQTQPADSYYYGNGSTAIDANAKATNHDEMILGIEYEFKDSWMVGFKYVGRKINDAVEDISFDSGNNYIIGNPGGDITFTNGLDEPLEFYDYNDELVHVDAGATYTLAASAVGFPKIKRDYNGYEFVLRRDYRDNYQFQFSYVNSATRGNYPGGTVTDGQVDPGITALFDLPSTTVNGDGFLPQHTRHQFKWDGSYETDFGLLIGASYRYTSGAGMDALGNPDVGTNNYVLPNGTVRRVTNGGYSDFNLLPRGTAGTLPAITSLDLHLDYQIKFTDRMNLSLYADIFNVFNFQEATGYSNQFSDDTPDVFDPSAPWNVGKPEIHSGDPNSSAARRTDAIRYANRYYTWINGQFSNLNELVDYYNDNGLTWNADSYGKPTTYQLGRRTRFGARFRF